MVEAEDNWWRKCWGIALVATILLVLCGPASGIAEGHVGCIFVESLCLDSIEWCFDDYAFGKCLPKFGADNEELLEREPLTEDQSRIMAVMLEEMQGAGLGWDHPFVQCRIQGAMFSLRRNTPLPSNLCANLAPDPEILDPQSPLAFVRFTPPDDEYADEIYYPPIKKGFDDRLYLPPLQPITTFNKENFETFANARDEPTNYPEFENRLREEELRRLFAEYELNRMRPNPYLQNEVLQPNPLLDNFRMKNLDYYRDSYKRTGTQEGAEIPTTSFREIAQAHHIPQQQPSDDYSHYQHSTLDALLPVHRVPKTGHHSQNELDFAPNTYPIRYKKYKELPLESSGVYTEGGLVFVPARSDDIEEIQRYSSKQEARDLLASMLGFTRHERLDVKKPGPLIGPPPSSQKDVDALADNKNKSSEVKAANKEVLPAHIKGDGDSKAKKFTHGNEDHAPHTVDTEYAHVMLKTPVDDWAHGSRIVTALADILNMKSYLTHPRVDSHEVSFRVEQNPERKTAADVARAINEPKYKNNLSRRLGVTVLQAGVGDKTKKDTSVTSSRIELTEDGPDVTHIMAYMFAGAGAAAVVVIIITLILIRRHDKKRDKLGGLQHGLAASESCTKDYQGPAFFQKIQELCRSRMAGKGGASDTVSSGRITSLTKENDKPPSSRSSTSSWSEEPALTNMDISTGHMVLSYMEDHLRNKGRLQREWEALCRYEAEPSAREAAVQSQSASLNRPGAPLPYDHSRVVLNHLANAEGLDYINASTITDHDPRAPAYIAAQGPLPTTLAHFWQMIWEQGAVVIVALCRLQENGDISCARYWPEEGAEVYHIYEVHLVSEHIWCDDYLVRSFYLKNLRTSETRTVTQFHFLSWPQGGVPLSSAKALLEFRRKVNKSYRGRSCPIVVHGSTGAGRTGAYILLDLVLGRMNKGAREIDIAATLEHLRDQRAGLVSIRQQFEFVLMAVAEEVHAILKALPAQTQGEKRELEKESSAAVNKEETATQSGEAEKQTKQDSASSAKNEKSDKEKDTKKDNEK